MIHLSTSEMEGGAARGAYRLHHALRKQGEDSRMFVLRQQTSEPTTEQYHPPVGSTKRLLRAIRREHLRRAQLPYQQSRPEGCEHFRDDRSPIGPELWDRLCEADIVNLHWVADFIDYQRFFPFAERMPLVWTMHDMNPFTGGCHYDLECGRFTSQCGACPQLGSSRQNDLSRAIHRRKAAALSTLSPERVRLVAGSRWLTDEAKKSSLLSRFSITTIHYGIDTSIFRPRNGSALRASLDIPSSAFVVLFAADHLSNHRKGLAFLLKALHRLPKNHQIYLLTAGSAGTASLDLPFPHIHLGYLSTETMLSLFYSAGDCFVIPSLQEVFGLTALEAMACATPVVGFATGGIPDMVKPGESGLLAPTGDVSDLSRQIEWMIDHPEAALAMGKRARLLAEREFTLDIQAGKYEAIYNELTEATAVGSSSKRSGK